MQNIPIPELIASATCLVAYVKFGSILRSVGSKLKPDDGSGKGSMIWSTKDGAVYEDVGVFFVRGDGVTFRHRFGTVRLPISTLTDASRAQLVRRHHEDHALAILPIEKDPSEERPCEVEAA